MKKYEIHEIAAVMPEMTEVEFNELREDIRQRGCIVPLVIYEGKILDGRHRYRACVETGQLFYEQFYTESDPAGYVLSLHNRRNLTVSQRAAVAAQLANMRVGKPKKEDEKDIARIQAITNEPLISQEGAAKAAGVSRNSVQQAKKVIERASPEVVSAVKSGKMTVNAAAKTIEPKPAPEPKIPEKNDSFNDACDRIASVMGRKYGQVVRDGTVIVDDLDYFVSLNDAQMQAIGELVIVGRWKVKKALRQIEKPIDGETRLDDLINRCVAAKGTFKCSVGTCEITLHIPNSANW